MSPATERAFDLLAEYATVGLPSEGQRELDQLLDRDPHLDTESFELAAAAIELVYTDTREPLPVELNERLLQQATSFYAAADDDVPGPSVSSDPAGTRSPEENEPARVVDFPTQGAAPRRDTTAWLGWLAAAAALVLAILGWLPRPGAETSVAVQSDPPAVTSPSPEEALAAFAGRATDLVQIAWSTTDDPAAADGAGGEVFWSTAQQSGFMSFQGLAINDPGLWQYQLWIFDEEQDERYPIDGGVFDISGEGVQIIEIDAKLRVVRPTLFAITVEKPGGVVVSSRERLPLLAEVPATEVS